MNNEDSKTIILKSKLGNVPSNMEGYFNEAGDDDLKTSFKKQNLEAEKLFQSINEEKSKYKYAPGKWTLKEVLQHLIDAERVFAYRALAFARKDTNTLPSFDENDYANNSKANDRSWSNLISEFFSVRQSTEFLFDSFSAEALETIGKASSYTIGVNTLGFVIIGHTNHHITIVKERYLN
ncbi:MAG: DinB family protein [Ginsengibacter sp.]